MKIAGFELGTGEQAAWRHLGLDHVVSCTTEALNPFNAADFADVEVVSTFIDSKLGAETLEGLGKLRLIATRSTGYDHIDLDYCKGAGITVCNVPSYGDATVAEHTFALLLALSRRITIAAERTRRGDFSQAGLRGFDLSSKTLGVIGVGGIGRRVIRIAKGFGMDVVAFDTKPDKTLENAMGVRFAGINDVIGTCDVLTLHVPGGAGTQDMISTEQLALMKPEAVLINTSRGGAVNAEALIHALAEGRLAGAALDVLSEESWLRDEAQIFREGSKIHNASLRTLAADHTLLGFANVIVTPHIAYDTREAVGRLIDTTLENIQAFANGGPQNVVSD
ncbi:2-hydroxyacid dehydrogenase [soil metagenome]